MSNNPSITATDPITALVQVATQSIKEVVLVGSKVDNLADKMKTQEQLLREVQLGLQEVKTATGITSQSIESIRGVTMDHEQRIRATEAKIAELHAARVDYTEFKDIQNKHNEKTTAAIEDVQKTLIRYGAIGAIGLLFLQVALNAFIIPWLQVAIK